MTLSAKYSLHGILLEVLVPEGPWEGVIEDTMDYKGADRVETSALPQLVLDLAPAGKPPMLPASAVLITEHEHGVGVYHEGPVYYLTLESGSIVVVEPAAERATFYLDDTLGAPMDHHAKAMVFYLFLIALLIMLRYQGWYALHAAALERDGLGVLLSAVSGSGKTTTTLNLMRAGWNYATDDTVLLREQPGGLVEAVSYRKAFSLTDETLDRIPELRGTTWPRPPGLRPKWRVDVGGRFPSRFVPRLVPRVVVFPRIDEEGPSRVEPMVPRDALLYLITQTGLSLTPDPAINRPHMHLVGALVRQCTCLQLIAGHDVREDPQRVDHLLTEAIAAHVSLPT